MAYLVDGTFTESGFGLEIISAPPLTHAIIRQLREIYEQTEAGEITADQAAATLQEIAPEIVFFYNLFKRIGDSNIQIILALIGIYLMIADGFSTDRYRSSVLNELQMTNSMLKSAIQSSITDTKKTSANDKSFTTKKTPAKKEAKSQSTRRSEVNKERRKDLVKKRRQFSPKTNK